MCQNLAKKNIKNEQFGLEKKIKIKKNVNFVFYFFKKYFF